MTHVRQGIGLLALAFFVAASVAGCSYLGLQRQADQPGAQAAATAPEKTSVYYDFDDIAVPAGFKLVKDDSFVYQSGSLRNGLLVFEGRVEPISAANFIVAAMTRDGWRMKSSFKYGRSLMLFEKPNKVALVSVKDGMTSTRLEVWVAPTPETPAPAMRPTSVAPAPAPLAPAAP
jgi:hypothetical protein